MGDEEAIRFILKYFEPMIVDASKRMVRTDKDTIKEVVKDFAKYIIPYIRDFAESQEGKTYIAKWKRNHPEYEDDEFAGYDYDDEDDEEL